MTVAGAAGGAGSGSASLVLGLREAGLSGGGISTH